MITRNILRSLGALAAITLALLALSSPATAQAPPPEYDVFVYVNGAQFACVQIGAPTGPPTEAQHEKPSPKTPIFGSPSPTMSQKPNQETTATYAIPPTFTPSIQASPTPTTIHADPTQETAQTPTAQPLRCTVDTARGLNVRSQPGTYGDVVGVLANGTAIDPVRVGGAGLWYEIEKPLSGWIAAWLVRCG